MEKDYKVRFYYFGEGPDRILTTTQLLELAGKITERTPFTDLSGAIEVVARYFNIPTYQVLKQNLSLSIDDFVGNIKPDGHFTEKLDLNILKNSVDQHSYFVESFSNFSNDEKTIICKFIEKAIELYRYDTRGDDLFIFLRDKMQTILLAFVHNLFQTDDPRNIHNQLLQMQKFNSIELMVSKGKSKRDSLSFSFGITLFSMVLQKSKNHLKIICFYIIVFIANFYIV